ncbi:MAG: prolipoprotein diacylglyceryl transferase [Bacillota bacterium]
MDILAVIDPILVQFGPITIRWYGLIIVSAIMIAIWLGYREAPHRGLDPEFVPDLGMVLVPTGILGARLYEVFILQWPYYSQHPGEILAIWQGGLAIHGAVLGAMLAGSIFMWYRKQPFWAWADIVAPSLILAQAIGRWGNFFNQEAYGDAAPQWLVDLMPNWLREGMTIGGTVMHPTFLYESVWNLLSFFMLYYFHRKKAPTGVVFSLYFIAYNTGRFMIESIRKDSSFIFGWVRVAQLTSLVLVVAGFALLLYHLKRSRGTHNEAA